jgi:BirA family biotin operon repressor/biotin-[acetyl-CoA-carboxylase] ligase
MMATDGYSFVILKYVDSTNNYAMAAVHEGLAKHGDAVFAYTQTNGKGQRGKVWETGEAENIALSIIIEPGLLKAYHPFQLSATVALGVYDFFSKYAGEETTIKWPNDVFWRDRKAGGVLIENVISGSSWKWAVAGIGININQTVFNPGIRNPVSLKQITGKEFEPADLAAELHRLVMARTGELSSRPYEALLEEYQQHLYKMNGAVKLKKDNMVFETLIKGISPQGKLKTKDVLEKEFEFGEVEWIL